MVRALVLHCPVPLQEIAEAKRISLHRLRKWNDFLPEETLWRIGIVYVQPKRKRSLTHRFYITRGGETPAEIAQRFGIRLSALAALNGWSELPEHFASADTVCLRGKCTRPHSLAGSSRQLVKRSYPSPAFPALEPDWAYLTRVPCQFIQHRVQQGESLNYIARHYQIPVDWLYVVNPDLARQDAEVALPLGRVIIVPVPLTETYPDSEPELPF